MEKRKKLCQHEMKDRKWTDVYNFRELAYAVCELKYTLFGINEGLVYTNRQPIFQEFMRMMASKKIRYAAVPPSYRKDLESYCSELNSSVGFTTLKTSSVWIAWRKIVTSVPLPKVS